MQDVCWHISIMEMSECIDTQHIEFVSQMSFMNAMPFHLGD